MEIETIPVKNQTPHVLKKLPPRENFLSDEIYKELLEARIQIAELKGYCLDNPNPLLLLSPSIIKESLASSEIENIHTTLINVFQNSLIPEIERKPADKEVLRYREAIIFGSSTLKKKPVIGRNLILGIQSKLMQVEGEGFRTDQNAIVNPKNKEIIFVPPKSEDINDLIKNWEEYVNNISDDVKNDPLIKAAIAHYQFESIHPFNDGNGRTGRILMVLQLVKADILTAPILYMSGYINKNKSEYYRLLREVTNKDAWKDYLLFMVKGFKEQAIITKKHLLETNVLFKETISKVKDEAPTIYSHELIEAIFTAPIITPTALAKKLSVHHITAGNYLKKLQKIGIMRSQKYGKYQMYGNIKLINLLNK
jgi:Fic family protein